MHFHEYIFILTYNGMQHFCATHVTVNGAAAVCCPTQSEYGEEFATDSPVKLLERMYHGMPKCAWEHGEKSCGRIDRVHRGHGLGAWVHWMGAWRMGVQRSMRAWVHGPGHGGMG